MNFCGRDKGKGASCALDGKDGGKRGEDGESFGVRLGVEPKMMRWKVCLV